MLNHTSKSRLLASAAIGVVVALACGATAFAADQPAPSKVTEVVVTGSRIPRSQTKTPAPVDLLPAQDLTDRGYTDVGDALNKVTANTPSFPVTPSASGPAGSGQTYPNLFNLGPGRTLTLVGGHRFVASSSPNTPSSAAGFGAGGTGQGNSVDTGLIPLGLLDHVEVVEAGGAAVYGSDAIAGVVNYILKKDFEGVVADVQGGESWKSDHKQFSARVTAGHNFLDGRANVSVDLEYSKVDPLLMSQRDYPAIGRFAGGLSVIPQAHFYSFNNTGVIFKIPAPVAIPPCGNPPPTPAMCFLQSGGVPTTFSADGQSIIPYNPGVSATGGSILTPPFAEGGDGYRLQDLTALATGVERKTANFLGHFDITDHVKLSGQFLYGRELGNDPVGSQGVFKTVLSPAPENALTFFATNPWLSTSDLATLTAARPSFGAGAPLFLSKAFNYLLPTEEFQYPTDTYFGLVQLDGDFDRWDRHFVWSAAYSHGSVDSKQEGWSVLTTQFLNAISATPTGLLCNVTAPGCVPINPFGDQKPTAAQWAYIGTPIGYEFHNQEDDFLATFGGDLFKLPGGEVKFSTAYEYRRDTAGFAASAAQHAGLVFGQSAATPNTGGWNNASEYSAELLIPVLGDTFTPGPWLKGLDLSAQGRIVEDKACGFSNGAAVGCNQGQNTVWGLGASLRLDHGITLRASRSQNFRAPTLYQLFAPSSTALGGGIIDPCDNRFIAQGPNPTVRLANCTALFAANPTYGTGPGEAAPGSNTATRLAAFEGTSVNFSTANITSGGNAALKNEISETTTYGLVFQPDFVPGALTITADYLSIHLLNGITAFTPTNFAESCLDSPGGSAPTCAFFTRDADGNINNAVSSTFNAESLQYKGEVVNIIYKFPLEWITRHDTGNLESQLEVTHNDELRQSVAGAVTEAVGTIAEPRWVVRGDARYTYGPFRFTYQFFYLPASLVAQGATAANTAAPVAGSNTTHSISASYDFGHFQIRAGVNNLTNVPPSFPTLTYGDYIGRTIFVGLKARY